MQGRRRIGRKEGDFGETLSLFRQLIQLVNSKSVNSVGQTNEPKRKAQPHTIEKKIFNTEPKEQPKEPQKESKVQKMQKIGLRSWRDWQGLCSQRKEDVFGEYAVCFEYSIPQELAKVIIDTPQNGAYQSQAFSYP